MAQNNDPFDIKGLMKPTTFDGEESNWNDWSFQMKAYLGCLGEYIALMLEHAATEKFPVTLARVSSLDDSCACSTDILASWSREGDLQRACYGWPRDAYEINVDMVKVLDRSRVVVSAKARRSGYAM